MKHKKTFIIIQLLMCTLLCCSSSYSSDLNIDTKSPFLSPEYSNKISMDFQEAALVDILKIFSQQTNMNLITSEDIADKKITVYLENVPVEQALEQILRANSLTYELQPNSNIFIVKALSTPDVELITRVYQLKHAMVSGSKLTQTFSIQSDDDSSLIGGSSEDKVGIVQALEASLSRDSSGRVVGSIIEDLRTNSVIVTDIANNFPRIEATIARLDVPVVQILIEVEMLEVSKTVSSQLGVKMGGTPLSFYGGTRQHVYPWNQNRLLDKGYEFEDAEYTTGLIDASGFSATLQFLRAQSDTKNLARPRIMTLNNEPAQIKISTDEAIGSKTETSSSEGTSSSSVEAERVETGVVLTVTPHANPDSGEITMAVVPRVIIARTGGTFAGQTFKDPEERVAKSMLRMQAGDTIIIGGLIREDKTITNTKVPILGDIPFIGGAFRHKDESISERELIIFITPHILNATPVPKTVAVTPEVLVREQDVPEEKLSNNIGREISNITIENKK